jgi:hypothetical protein
LVASPGRDTWTALLLTLFNPVALSVRRPQAKVWRSVGRINRAADFVAFAQAFGPAVDAAPHSSIGP